VLNEDKVKNGMLFKSLLGSPHAISLSTTQINTNETIIGSMLFG